MRDTVATLFRAGRTASRAAIAAMLLAMACGLGGCAGGGAASGCFRDGRQCGATVAFESIDGPPPQVFDRMVGVLDSESKLRNLSIVSREGSASYRVRSYLAAEVSRGRTTIAWVWDVYDRNQQRALAPFRRGAGRQGRTRRLGRGRRSGAAADRAGRIERPQRHGQRDRASDAPPLQPAPELRGPAVASADQPAPASGAFNVSALGSGSALGYSDR